MKNWTCLQGKFSGTLICLLFISKMMAQCPYDIGESRSFEKILPLIYLDFEDNTVNNVPGEYLFYPDNVVYKESQCGKGAYFNGTNSLIRVEPSLYLDKDFTIMAWIKVEEQINPMGIFSIREQCESNYRGFSLAQFNINEYQTEGLNYQVNKHSNCSGWSGGDRYKNEELILSNEEFVFVAVRVSGNQLENRVVNLISNCDEFETTLSLDFDTGKVFDLSQEYITTIGASSIIQPFINSFYGIIDEFRIYNEVLSYEDLNLLYRQCRPIEVFIDHYQTCGSGNSLVRITNTEKDVNYQLFNLSKGEFVGDQYEGNCAELTFIIDHSVDQEFYQILASNQTSACSIFMDTIISTDALQDTIFTYESIEVCMGDSLFIEDYIEDSYLLFDTINSNQGCDTIKELMVNMIPEPSIELGIDTVLCLGDSLLFDWHQKNSMIIWNDQYVSDEFLVDFPQTLKALVYNICGELYDEVEIDFENCCDLYFPNVFTPNNDGNNDLFRFYYSEKSCDNIKDFQMRIYNRWGEIVFESLDLNNFWNGKIDELDAEQGIYIYMVNYNIGSITKSLFGDIALIR